MHDRELREPPLKEGLGWLSASLAAGRRFTSSASQHSLLRPFASGHKKGQTL